MYKSLSWNASLHYTGTGIHHKMVRLYSRIGSGIFQELTKTIILNTLAELLQAYGFQYLGSYSKFLLMEEISVSGMGFSLLPPSVDPQNVAPGGQATMKNNLRVRFAEGGGFCEPSHRLVKKNRGFQSVRILT